MRPSQWIKNGFVFAPLVFSAGLMSPYFALRDSGLPGVLPDRERDLPGTTRWIGNPTWRIRKKRRVPYPLAVAAGAVLLAMGVGAALALGVKTGGLLASYAAAIVAYAL